MAKMQATSSNPEPYKWDEEFLVPPEALALWERVGKGEDIGKGKSLSANEKDWLCINPNIHYS